MSTTGKDQYNDCLEIDETYLDEGLRDFSDMLERLGSYCDKTLDSEGLTLLQELRAFLVKRFRHEERIMRADDAEDYAIHRQQHMILLDNLTWSIEMARQNNKISGDLKEFLAEWYHFHFSILDRPQS